MVNGPSVRTPTVTVEPYGCKVTVSTVAKHDVSVTHIKTTFHELPAIAAQIYHYELVEEGKTANLKVGEGSPRPYTLTVEEDTAGKEVNYTLVIDLDKMKVLLAKGATYKVEVTATGGGLNVSAEGTMRVPVTVETLTASPNTVQINPGDVAAVSLAFDPINPDNRGVIASTTDTSVATAAADGAITAHAQGTAVITFTAADDFNGASAQVNVLVTDSTSYPELIFSDQLTAEQVMRIQQAAEYLRLRLVENGVDVPMLLAVTAQRNTHPAQIRTILNTLRDNCITVRQGAINAGLISGEELPAGVAFGRANTGKTWHSTVQQLIALLNGLNERLS